MYICSARNIYIYLCPQIYGIAHTPCYQFVLHNFVTTKRKLGKYLIFVRPLGRVGGNLGGQARGRSLSAPLAAPTRYRGGSLHLHLHLHTFEFSIELFSNMMRLQAKIYVQQSNKRGYYISISLDLVFFVSFFCFTVCFHSISAISR